MLLRNKNCLDLKIMNFNRIYKYNKTDFLQSFCKNVQNLAYSCPFLNTGNTLSKCPGEIRSGGFPGR